MLEKLAAPVKRQETTEVQGAQVIPLLSQGVSYTKIAEQTGIGKIISFDVVKCYEECREPYSKNGYTASAPRGGCPQKMFRY